MIGRVAHASGPIGAPIGAALVALVTAFVPVGEVAAAEETFRLPRTYVDTLDNGLEVVVAPRPGVGLVDLRIVVKVGAWLEGERVGTGISHYAEHLVAGGTTATRSEAESAERLRALGGLKNARTEADRTWIWLTTTTDGVEEGLSLIADWVRAPSFPSREFDRERNVIFSEFDRARDNDMQQAWELAHATAFSRHPARLPNLGDRVRFETITRDDVAAFHAEHWVPGNAIVSVVGDVDVGEAFLSVREAFGGWERGERPQIRLPIEPLPDGRREARRTGVSARSSVALAWRAIPFHHPDAIPLQILKVILTDGAGARLVQRLIDPGLAGGLLVRARTPVLDGGLFLILGHVAPTDVGRFEREVSAELALLVEHGPTEDELARAKRRMRAQLVLGTRTVESLAHTLTRDWVMTDDTRYAEAYVSLLDDVTIDDVTRAAAATFRPDRLAVAVVGRAEAETLAEEVEEEPPGSRNSGAEALSFDNGVSVRMERRPDEPDVAVHVAFAAGSMREGNAFGASSLVADLMLRRPATRDAVTRLEAAGGAFSSASDRFAIELSGVALAEDVELLLDVVESLFDARGVDPKALEQARARARTAIASRGRSSTRVAEDRLLSLAFGGAFAPPADGVAAFDRLGDEDVMAFRRDAVTGDNVVVSVVGRFDAGAVRARLESMTADLERGTRWRPRVAAPEWAGFADASVEEEVAHGQVSIVLGFDGCGVDAPDRRVAVDLVDAWWSGRTIPSGPLYDAVRGDRDLAYYVHAFHRPMPGAGILWVLVQCAPERAAEVIEAVDKSVTSLVETGMTVRDLATARNVLLASRQSVIQAAVSRARILSLAEVYDLPFDAGDAYRARVAATDVDAVNEVIRSCFAGGGKRLVLWPKGVKRP